MVAERIAKQFEEPRRQSTLQDVATTRADTLLRETITPEVEKFKSDVDRQVDGFQGFLAPLKNKFQNDYEVLSREVSMLKQRNYLVLLADRATADGNRRAFDELKNFLTKKNDQDLITAANAQIARVISFWVWMTRIEGGLNYAQLAGRNKEKGRRYTYGPTDR